ncbi:MAG: hypothetical protein ABJM81_15125 [Rhodopirellula bahusiensis]
MIFLEVIGGIFNACPMDRDPLFLSTNDCRTICNCEGQERDKHGYPIEY